MTRITDFQARRLDGSDYDFQQLAQRVVLVVNTASACGFTPQFAGLETLHRTLGPRGLVVLGFPCNQFGGQDPGSAEEIGAFCQRNYGVSFAMMERSRSTAPTHIRCLPGSSTKGPGCWAVKRSNGTSPSSWSGAMVRSCGATRRKMRRRSWRVTLRRHSNNSLHFEYRIFKIQRCLNGLPAPT